MNTATSPHLKARIAGVFYLLTIIVGIFALVSPYGKLAANLVADVCYVVVTFLFYALFKLVDKTLSLVAALCSLAGCTMGVFSLFDLAPWRVNPLVFFGAYCLLTGYLIFRSTFLPRTLGILMAVAGFAWLTFLSPSFAKSLSPYNTTVGGIAESSVCLWLLIMGVNVERWKVQVGRGVAERNHAMHA